MAVSHVAARGPLERDGSMLDATIIEPEPTTGTLVLNAGVATLGGDVGGGAILGAKTAYPRRISAVWRAQHEDRKGPRVMDLRGS